MSGLLRWLTELVLLVMVVVFVLVYYDHTRSNGHPSVVDRLDRIEAIIYEHHPEPDYE
jgi:uncharacterized membrane protein